jgi:hypothetical protein
LTAKRTDKIRARDVTGMLKNMILIIEEELEEELELVNLKEGKNKSDQLLKENRLKFSKCVPDDEVKKRTTLS